MSGRVSFVGDTQKVYPSLGISPTDDVRLYLPPRAALSFPLPKIGGPAKRAWLLHGGRSAAGLMAGGEWWRFRDGTELAVGKDDDLKADGLIVKGRSRWA